jgi:hypothetical protein
MSKKKSEEKGLIAQRKEAICSSRKSLYQLGKESTVGNDRLYRFMQGKRGLTIIDAVEKLCNARRLRLTPEPPEQADEPEPPPEKPGDRAGKGKRN